MHLRYFNTLKYHVKLFIDLYKVKKLYLFLSGKLTGPIDHSSSNYVKLSFKEGYDPTFSVHLSDTIVKRTWETVPLNMTLLTGSQNQVKSFFLNYYNKS